MDETFLVLLAAILGTLSLAVYMSLLESQKAMGTTLLSVYLQQHGYQELESMLAERYVTLGSAVLSRPSPSSQELPSVPKMGLELAAFKAKISTLSELQVCLLIKSASQEEIQRVLEPINYTLLNWFSGIGFGASLNWCNTSDDDLACYRHFVMRNPKFARTCDAVIILDNLSPYRVLLLGPRAVVINPERCWICGLAATIAEITGYVYTAGPCVTSELLSINSNLARGIICPENVQRLIAYFASKTNPVLTYRGPTGNLSQEISRLQRLLGSGRGYYVPGLSFCLLRSSHGLVACDLRGCETASSELASLRIQDSRISKSLIERTRYLCEVLYGTCKPLWCVEQGTWYRVTGSILEPVELSSGRP